jgi:hypothetical protein
MWGLGYPLVMGGARRLRIGRQRRDDGLISTNVPHHLARHFSGIFAHNTANFATTALFSTAYEGLGTHGLGVVLTAGQPNPARCCEGLKYDHFMVHAVRVFDYEISHTRGHRCSVMTKLFLSKEDHLFN